MKLVIPPRTWLALGLVLTACNGSNSGNGGTAAVSGACGNLISAYCNKINDCSPSTITDEFGDLATCVSRTSLSCAGFDQLPGTSWTSDKIEGCTAVISTSSCQDLSAGISSDACKSGPGSLPNGSACGDNAQCAGGRCNKNTASDGGFSTQTSFCGKCETTTPSTCGDAGACVSPQRCSYDSVARASRCVTPVGEGAACDTGIPCNTGLTCKNAVCVKRMGKDAPCETSSDCDSTLGLSCIEKTCQPPTHVGPGQACASPSPRCSAGSDCIYSFSSDGGSTSVCVTRAADNAACDESKGPRCTSPARCLNGVCTLPDYAQCK
jgi:hypothetical protein